MKLANVVVGILLAACGRDPTLDKLKVTIGGKPITMSRAFIKRLPVDGRYQVYLTTGDASCKQLLDNFFMTKGKPTTLLFDVGPRLAADGTLTPVVTQLFGGPATTEVQASTIAIAGKADQDTKVEITIDAKIKSTDGDVTMAGTFTAAGCGDQAPDPSGSPKAKHASTATITVAGKQLPIASAIRKGATSTEPGPLPSRTVVLSTGPKDCSPFTPWAAVIVTDEWGFYHLEGLWFDKPHQNSSARDPDGQPETKAMTIKEGAKGTSADGPTIQLELAGKGTIDGYPVELAGTIEALDCPE